MKQLCQLLLHDDSFHASRFEFPLLIRFRDLNRITNPEKSGLIIDEITRTLGIQTDLPKRPHTEDAERIKSIKRKMLTSLLEEMKILLILDGFDELAPATHRAVALEEIRSFALHLSSCTFVVTSRTGEFAYHVDGATQYEICPLTKPQISAFAQKWLLDKHLASDFVSKVYRSPFADTAIRPLTLAHLCAIYERIGKVPDKPKTIYRKVIDLLLEAWDQQRSVKRISKYGHFEIDRKFEFLCQIAFVLTTKFRRIVFTKENLLEAYEEVHEDYGLLSHEAQQVVDELESHTGLFLQSGYQQYEFAHKSLQEYLTAEYLVRLPAIPKDKTILAALPNELAIAVSISSKPSAYFSTLIIERLMKQDLPRSFFKAFLDRLLLEKPDFNQSTDVGISLVVLHSKYNESIFVSPFGAVKSEAYSEGLIKEFDDVFKRLIHKTSLAIFKSGYTKENPEYLRANGEVIYCIGKRKAKNDPSLGIINSLPKQLFVARRFLVELVDMKPTEEPNPLLPRLRKRSERDKPD
jgi:NACHT domain